MLAAVGLAVSRVIRVRYDAVALGELYRGASRPLTPAETKAPVRSAPASHKVDASRDGAARIKDEAASSFGLSLLASPVALAQDKIIVSGASGQLGSLVIDELLARNVAPENLILVSRTPNTDHLSAYAARGASVRFGDFNQPESLDAAYRGGTRMLLISINGGGGRPTRAPSGRDRCGRAGRGAGRSRIRRT